MDPESSGISMCIVLKAERPRSQSDEDFGDPRHTKDQSRCLQDVRNLKHNKACCCCTCELAVWRSCGGHDVVWERVQAWTLDASRATAHVVALSPYRLIASSHHKPIFRTRPRAYFSYSHMLKYKCDPSADTVSQHLRLTTLHTPTLYLTVPDMETAPLTLVIQASHIQFRSSNMTDACDRHTPTLEMHPTRLPDPNLQRPLLSTSLLRPSLQEPQR